MNIVHCFLSQKSLHPSEESGGLDGEEPGVEVPEVPVVGGVVPSSSGVHHILVLSIDLPLKISQSINEYFSRKIHICFIKKC